MMKKTGFLAVLALIFVSVGGDEHDHRYESQDEVVLWMNTVGPYHNRQETYAYFSLPFCMGPKESISHYHETLGEALQGTELEFSGLDIQFRSEYLYTYTQLCPTRAESPRLNFPP